MHIRVRTTPRTQESSLSQLVALVWRGGIGSTDQELRDAEYTPRLSAARRRAKRCGKVSELPAVGAIGEDAALLYDAVATAELDAARTPPSTDNEDDALALMALSMS